MTLLFVATIGLTAFWMQQQRVRTSQVPVTHTRAGLHGCRRFMMF